MSRFAKQMLVAGFAAFSMATAVSGASAQDSTSSTCQDLQKILDQRKSLVEQLNKASANKKQLDAKFACSVFSRLESNGKIAAKWLEENKAWCQVPEDFVAGFMKDHTQVGNLRGQACKVAAQMDAQRKQAQQGGNPAWGGGLSGQYRMPKGAL